MDMGWDTRPPLSSLLNKASLLSCQEVENVLCHPFSACVVAPEAHGQCWGGDRDRWEVKSRQRGAVGLLGSDTFVLTEDFTGNPSGFRHCCQDQSSGRGWELLPRLSVLGFRVIVRILSSCWILNTVG